MYLGPKREKEWVLVIKFDCLVAVADRRLWISLSYAAMEPRRPYPRGLRGFNSKVRSTVAESLIQSTGIVVSSRAD